jgi:hypothetical protein
MTENTSFEEVAEWIRKTYYKTVNYSDVGRWHQIYGEMNTITDIIRILKQKQKEELK